jgi:hypothetical protein
MGGSGRTLCEHVFQQSQNMAPLSFSSVPVSMAEGVKGGGGWRFVKISLDRAESSPSRIYVSMGMRRGDGSGREGRSYKPFQDTFV